MFKLRVRHILHLPVLIPLLLLCGCSTQTRLVNTGEDAEWNRRVVERLRVGDVVDVTLRYGSWYHGRIDELRSDGMSLRRLADNGDGEPYFVRYDRIVQLKVGRISAGNTLLAVPATAMAALVMLFILFPLDLGYD